MEGKPDRRPQEAAADTFQPPPRPQSRNAYRLFPSVEPTPPTSPTSLSKAALVQVNGYRRRRSISYDESSHGDVNSREGSLRSSIASRRGHKAPVPMKPMSTLQELPLDSPTIPAKLSYKPRLSEETCHGRSSSAPGEFGIPVAQQDRPNQSNTVRSMFSRRHDDHSSRPASSARQDLDLPSERTRQPAQLPASNSGIKRKANPNLRLQIEKPLPPPPLTAGPRSQSQQSSRHTPQLSGGTQFSREMQMTPDSAVGVMLNTPLPKQTPTTGRNSYFSLNAESAHRNPTSPAPPRKNSTTQSTYTHTHEPEKKFEKKLDPSPISPPSRFSVQVAALLERLGAERTPKTAQTHTVPEAVLPITETREAERCEEQQSPILSRVSSKARAYKHSEVNPETAVKTALEPQAHPTTAKENETVNADFSQREISPIRSTSRLSQREAPPESPQSEILSTLADLSKQSEALHVRYASLRADRQKLSSRIIDSLREQKPGPDYANTLLDEQMSLVTLASSMDICFAKLKSLDCRKEEAITALVAQTSTKSTTKKAKRSESVCTVQHSRSTSPTSVATPHEDSISAPRTTNTPDSTTSCETIKPILQASEEVQRRTEPMPEGGELTSDEMDEVPKRIRIKGAKAAKLLGLVDDLPSERCESPGPGITLPGEALGKEVEVVMKKSPSGRRRYPAVLPPRSASVPPERPLPAPPAPGSTKPVAEHSQAGASTSSSRASSPDSRSVRTPPVGVSSERSEKAASLQSIHVYVEESLQVYVEEEDLLDYYRSLN